MSEDPTSNGNGNGVRITNAQIYTLLQETNARVNSVQQTVKEVLYPGLHRVVGRVDALEKYKADTSALSKTEGRLATVEMRVYAIVAGLVAAFAGGKGIGLF